MEHLVPEQMFSTEETPAEGVSAVKALAIAAAEGQRIYTLTQSNLNTALSQLQLDTGTEQEIENAVNAGMEVTTHQYQINYNGWVGEGYIIIDPNTGAGAYKIAGGSNGAEVTGAASILLGIGSILTGAGSIFEKLVGLGKLFQHMGLAIGAIAPLLSVVDAVLSGCGQMATFWIFVFNYMLWLFSLLPFFFIFSIWALLIFFVAIASAQFFVTEALKEDFCDH